MAQVALEARQPRSTLTLRFFAESYRFEFQQAVRIAEHLNGGEEGSALKSRPLFQLRSRVFLSAPPSDVYAYEENHPQALWGKPVLEVNLLGLAGMTGPLPMPYTEMLLDRKKLQDHAMDDFLQIFNHRLLALYRSIFVRMTPGAYDVSPHKTDFGTYMMSLGGMGRSPHPLFAHGGTLWKRTLSAHQVQQILESYFEVPIVLEEYRGTFKTIPQEDVTLLGRQHSLLGQGASLGDRYWEETSGINLYVGPLSFEVYQRFMPGSEGYQTLLDTARMILSPEYDLNLEVVLDPRENPPPILGDNIVLGFVGSF